MNEVEERGETALSLASSPAKSGFCDQFRKLSAGYVWFLLAQGRQCQRNFGKRPQVAAARGGDFDLLYAQASVAPDSLESEEETLAREKTTDDVIRRFPE